MKDDFRDADTFLELYKKADYVNEEFTGTLEGIKLIVQYGSKQQQDTAMEIVATCVSYEETDAGKTFTVENVEEEMAQKIIRKGKAVKNEFLEYVAEEEKKRAKALCDAFDD